MKFDETFDFIFVIPFCLFALVPATIFLSLLSKAMWSSQHLQVSTAGLTLTNSWPIKRSVHQKASDIEEIYISSGRRSTRSRIGSGKTITTRTDHSKLVCGNGLSKEEASYIMALIKGVLVSK